MAMQGSAKIGKNCFGHEESEFILGLSNLGNLQFAKAFDFVIDFVAIDLGSELNSGFS